MDNFETSLIVSLPFVILIILLIKKIYRFRNKIKSVICDTHREIINTIWNENLFLNFKTRYIVLFFGSFTLFYVFSSFMAKGNEVWASLLYTIVSFPIIAAILYVVLFVLLLFFGTVVLGIKNNDLAIYFFINIFSLMIVTAVLLSRNSELLQYDWFLTISFCEIIFNLICLLKVISLCIKHELGLLNLWESAIFILLIFVLVFTNIVFIDNKIDIDSLHISNEIIKSTSLNYLTIMYYVTITFFTVGYGDIVPIHNSMRIITELIIITGFVSNTVLIGAVVSTTLSPTKNKIRVGEKANNIIRVKPKLAQNRKQAKKYIANWNNNSKLLNRISSYHKKDSNE
jgi:voltage-gated potassium channel